MARDLIVSGIPGAGHEEPGAPPEYGAIITAAVLDTAGGNLPTAVLVISVVFTLLVYWLAEEYAEVLGEQVEAGRLPSGAYIGDALAATWPAIAYREYATASGYAKAVRSRNQHSPETACQKQVGARLPLACRARRRSAASSRAVNWVSSLATSGVAP